MTLVSTVLGLLMTWVAAGHLPSWVLWIVVTWIAALMIYSAYLIVPQWLAKRTNHRRERMAGLNIKDALKVAARSLVEMSSTSHVRGVACLINGQGHGLGISSSGISGYQAHLRTIYSVARDLSSDLATDDANVLQLHARLMELMTSYLDVCRAVSNESRQQRGQEGQHIDVARIRELSKVVQEANVIARDLIRSSKQANEVAAAILFREFLSLVDD